MSNVVQENTNPTASRLAALKDRKKEFEERLKKMVTDIVQKGGDEKIRPGTLKGLYKEYLLRFVKDKLGVSKFPAVKTLKKDYRKLDRHELTLALCTEGLRDIADKSLLPALSRQDLLDCRKFGKSFATLQKKRKEDGSSDESESDSSAEEDEKPNQKRKRVAEKKKVSKRAKVTDDDVEEFLQCLAADVAHKLVNELPEGEKIE